MGSIKIVKEKTMHSTPPQTNKQTQNALSMAEKVVLVNIL